MDRKQLCDLLLNGISNSSTNVQVVEHANCVLKQLEGYIKDNCGLVGWSTDNIEHRLLSHMDLAEAIKDISDSKFYNSITRIWDFLLKGKSYELPLGVYELYITNLFLKGLLISSYSTTQAR